MEREIELETYYDYYKETNSLSKKAQASRNKCFVFLCVLEALSFLMIRCPDFVCGILNDAAMKKLESTIMVSNSILQCLIWILLAYVLIRYVQATLYVERQYVYLNLLEKRIGDLIDSGKDNIFGCEGERYLKDYPMVLNFIDLFYKMFCPILFSVINIVRIIVEWINNGSRLSTWCGTIVCMAIFIITWFYFFNIHKKITAWFMKCTLIKGIANFLNRCLKEV